MRLKDSMFRIMGCEENVVKVELDRNHPIYRAHFPGNPITPGVCIVQMVGELIANRLGIDSVCLHKVVNLKFTSPISPIEEPVIDFNFSSIERQDGKVKTKGMITARGSVMTKFSMVYKTT
jgi:3-hydroxyacyl-[acyl-carrier-protein] dehydratase